MFGNVRVEECSSSSVPAVLSETLVVPARTEIICPVTIRDRSCNNTRVIEPLQHSWQKLGVLVGRAIISGAEGAVLLRNPSNENVTLYKNTHLGVAQACALVDVNDTTLAQPIPELFDWGEASKYLTTAQLRKAKEMITEFSIAISKDKKSIA